jgi:hypothetical protein
MGQILIATIVMDAELIVLVMIVVLTVVKQT